MPRFFSSYGSPSTRPVNYPLGSTPVRFPPGQQVSIIPSLNLPGSPHLFHTQAEYFDAVDRLCTDSTFRLPLDMDAKAYLFGITNGHPGAVHVASKGL